MKTLYLIRHAKSSWDDSTQTDFERPLNERGIKDAPRVSNQLKNKNIIPDLIISSPATRAITTAEIFAGQLAYPELKIQTDERIYNASMKDLAEVVSDLDDNFDTVFLFGHNPGITNFANMLGDKTIDGMSTCAVIGIELDLISWKELDKNCGKIILALTPKHIID